MEMRPVTDSAAWAAMTARCADTDPQQTWLYGEGVRQYAGWEPVRHWIAGGGGPLALCQAFVRNVPGIGLVARVSNGPLFIERPGGTAGDRMDVLRRVKRYWVDERRAALHMAPCLPPEALPRDWAAQLGMAPSGEPVWASIRLSALLEPAAARAGMRRTGFREPLNKAERAGLEVRWSRTDADREFLLERYAEFQREKSFTWPAPDLARAMWREEPGAFHAGFASDGGGPLSGMAVFEYANTGFCFALWNGPRARETHAANLLFWESWLLAKRNGWRWLDLGGIDPVNLPGITGFKRGMGGVEYARAGAAGAWPAGVGIHGEIPRIAEGRGPDGADEILERVRTLVAGFVRETSGIDEAAGDGDSLIEGGLIDSLSIVSMVHALREAFDIEPAPHEMTAANFDSIQRIAGYVRDKQSATATGAHG